MMNNMTNKKESVDSEAQENNESNKKIASMSDFLASDPEYILFCQAYKEYMTRDDEY